jgi:class 3 adenylate cyclase
VAGQSKNLGEPEEVIRFPGTVTHVVDLGDLTVARGTFEPGWRWSTHVRPEVGGDWCQAHHIGYVLSGRLGIAFPDGSAIELGPNDVYDVPPGHDGYVIGHETVTTIEWTGVRAFAGHRSGAHGRALVTLLITDLVDSTVRANQLGDRPWRDLLSSYFGRMRDLIDRFNGREIKTTGDGMIVTFDGPANAIYCASGMIRASSALDLSVRAGVHVGEVELVGSDVRGVAVHEAERVCAAAAGGEILVSETTRALASTSGLHFEDRGVHELKGLAGERRLFAWVPAGPPAQP